MHPLLRVSLSHLTTHKLQALLLVLGIALGVAMIAAIDIATSSAATGFRVSAEQLAGRATHQITSASGLIGDSVYIALRTRAGVRAAAPVVEGMVDLLSADAAALSPAHALGDAGASGALPGAPGSADAGTPQLRAMRVLGVDPFAEAPVRSLLPRDAHGALPPTLLRDLLAGGIAVAMSADAAEASAVGIGDTIVLAVAARQVRARVSSILTPDDAATRRVLDNVLVCDIATAQEILGVGGRLSRIDLVLDSTRAADRALLAAAAAVLPPGVRIEGAGARASTIASMTEAFDLNLTALSLLALLVGVFLIYDTVTVSVVRRRPVLGTLRAMGVTRRGIFGMIVTETALLGAMGSLAGLALGILLGEGAVRLVARTISDLYYTSTVTDITLAPLSLVRAFAIGVGASVLAGLPPAREAARTEPAGALRRSVLEAQMVRTSIRAAVAGIGLFALAGLLIVADRTSVVLGFAAVFAVLAGAALWVPLLLRGMMRAVVPVTGALFGVVGRMAPRAVERALSRTAVAVAALMIAVSVIVGVGTMIGSFRATLTDWLHETLAADLFVSIPFTGAGRSPSVDASVRTLVARVPGVARTETARSVQMTSGRYGAFMLVAVSRDLAEGRRYTWSHAPAREVSARMRAGAVLVSESFAHRHGITRRDTAIVLPTDRGARRFALAGVYADFSSDRGVVLIDDAVYRTWWNDTGISTVAAFAAADVPVDTVAARVRAALAGAGVRMLVESNRTLRDNALAIFDRTFTITSALQLLAGFVAFVGVLSALLALQLERTREIGLLRAEGMTTRALRGMVLLETGLMGAAAGLLSLPVGLVMSLILVHIINLRSFGWTLAFTPHTADIVQAVLVAITAALVAGILPARRFARVHPAAALRME